jgi:hypothetical protein
MDKKLDERSGRDGLGCQEIGRELEKFVLEGKNVEAGTSMQ